jgi:hypothetical protein
MRHRLFQSIVVSGLLVGCGETVTVDPSAKDPADAGDGAVDATSADSGSDGAVQLQDAGTVQDTGPVLLACEPGWPTTKGCSFPTPGVICCQGSCCLGNGAPLEPEPDHDAGADAALP